MNGRGDFVRETFCATALVAVVGASALRGQTGDAPSDFGPSAGDYASIQAAIDANPGRRVFVPPGDHRIAERLRIAVDGGGLWGPGRVVQSNPKAPIVHVREAADVLLDGLTLTRPEGGRETGEEAVRVDGARNVSLRNLTLLENHSQAGAVAIFGSEGTEVLHCRIENYMRITVDDRMRSESERRDWGYAFRCIDGTGIVVKESRAALIEGNRGDESGRPANVDGGSIVAGNVVYDPTRGAADDDAASARPRYRYSVFLSPRPDGPRNVHFHANVFHPGEDGVANVPLKP